ncbi:hypothetical protein SGLAD_v1c03890 [Spiroplasma gladiatoris]|uniref:Uncharacterized protein n=1 Tax=Spiroplasma gladiatoris TaxID=2143 RepID=A0A4P7AIK7_9MOLU|nr:hypothetical protein [Spiroplasma gladiatoris]QBQ07588.1 hypothetical protein SGLAD_v1c03890 [Spiroplasma gladiatoris]
MFEKNDSKLLTSEIKLINEQLNAVKINPSLKSFIDKNIFFIKNNLTNLVKIKKIGSYAIDNVYNFDEPLVVDLLGLKYVNKEMYKTYLKEVDTKEHFDDCWICELNEEIFLNLKKNYREDNNIIVEWNTKKYFYGTDLRKDFFIHNDSIKINFFKNKKLIFIILIRTALIHSEYPVLLCMKNMYFKSNALEFIKTYKTLNKLTLKKLEILFFYIRLNFRKDYDEQQRLMMKILIMSDLQLQLFKNNYFKKWISTVYYFLFNNDKVVNELFETNKIYYKKNKKISNLYNSFKLNNLTWVFHKTFISTKDFLDKYLYEVEDWIKQKKYKIEPIYFWYDSNPYIQNTSHTSSFTLKKENKLYDNLEIKFYSKEIYPSDKSIGIFLVWLSFYKFEILPIREEG